MLDGHPHRALVQDRVCAATGARSDVTEGSHVPIVPGRAGRVCTLAKTPLTDLAG